MKSRVADFQAQVLCSIGEAKRALSSALEGTNPGDLSPCLYGGGFRSYHLLGQREGGKEREEGREGRRKGIVETGIRDLLHPSSEL